jgi:hypothetical protein
MYEMEMGESFEEGKGKIVPFFFFFICFLLSLFPLSLFVSFFFPLIRCSRIQGCD